MLQQPFFQVTLPIIIAIVVAIWSQNKGMDSVNKRIDDLKGDIKEIKEDIKKMKEDVGELKFTKWR